MRFILWEKDCKLYEILLIIYVRFNTCYHEYSDIFLNDLNNSLPFEILKSDSGASKIKQTIPHSSFL